MRGSESDYDLLEENITGNDREGNSEELEESNSDMESISNKQFEPESDPTGSSSKPESDSESEVSSTGWSEPESDMESESASGLSSGSMHSNVELPGREQRGQDDGE